MPTQLDVHDCTRVVEIVMFFDGINNNSARDVTAFDHTEEPV